MPGDSAMVRLVSCHGSGGSGVSGDRDWTFDRGAIAGCTGVDVETTENECAHTFVSFTCIFVCTFTCIIFTIYYNVLKYL